MTYPDIIVICGLSKLIEDLDSVLKIDSALPQLLSYDTTFQLGDSYVSPLLYRHTLFDKAPVIPSLFLIHERKFQDVHVRFMQLLAKLLPTLVTGKKTIPLVTDEEVGIYQVFTTCFLVYSYVPIHNYRQLESIYPKFFAFAVGTTQLMQLKHGYENMELQQVKFQPLLATFVTC